MLSTGLFSTGLLLDGGTGLVTSCGIGFTEFSESEPPPDPPPPKAATAAKTPKPPATMPTVLRLPPLTSLASIASGFASADRSNTW